MVHCPGVRGILKGICGNNEGDARGVLQTGYRDHIENMVVSIYLRVYANGKNLPLHCEYKRVAIKLLYSKS